MAPTTFEQSERRVPRASPPASPASAFRSFARRSRLCCGVGSALAAAPPPTAFVPPFFFALDDVCEAATSSSAAC